MVINKGRGREKRFWHSLTGSRRRLGTVLLSAFLLLGGFWLGQAAVAGTSAIPGSQEDPLVTASWVESRLRELTPLPEGSPVDLSRVEDRLQELEKQVSELEEAARPLPPPRFEVVQVPAGKTLYTGHGTEVVVRAGSVRVVEGQGGGLSDLTGGASLLSGAGVKLNHLLLSAREDGRGLAAREDSLLLIRGSYKIE